MRRISFAEYGRSCESHIVSCSVQCASDGFVSQIHQGPPPNPSRNQYMARFTTTRQHMKHNNTRDDKYLAHGVEALPFQAPTQATKIGPQNAIVLFSGEQNVQGTEEEQENTPKDKKGKDRACGAAGFVDSVSDA